MKKYYFAWPESRDGELVFDSQEEISLEVVKSIENMTSDLALFVSEHLYYRMLVKNFSEVLVWLEEFDVVSKFFKFNHDYIPYHHELNRLMINALNGTYVYFQHFGYKLSTEENKQQLTYFRELRNAFLEEHFLYRFFDKLRNYAVHCSIPVTLLRSSIEEPSKAFHFDVHALLRDYNAWGDVRKDLQKDRQSGNDKYCVRTFIMQALLIYQEFHLLVNVDHIQHVRSILAQLRMLIRTEKNQGRFPVFLIIDEEIPEKVEMQSAIESNYMLAVDALKDLTIDIGEKDTGGLTI